MLNQKTINSLEISKVRVTLEFGEDYSLVMTEDGAEVTETKTETLQRDVTLNCAVNQAIDKVVLVEYFDGGYTAFGEQLVEVVPYLLLHGLPNFEQQEELG
jgi:thiamine monophosphate kinase